MTETASRPTTNSSTLPDSWEWTTLAEIGTVASGGTPKTKESSNFDGDVPWITPADLSGYTDKTIAQGKRNISQKVLNSSSARLLPEGTVIFSSRAPVGYVVIARNSIATNQGCKNLITSDSISNEYVYHYLKGSKRLAESYASGTTFLELSAKAFGRLPIPLPPLSEQRRIVKKIEELFTKLDAGVRSLEQARAQLKSYRQSVLKAAVEGDLSREWREAHKDELEPASELREKFAGKKYKEPASPDTSKLPALPDGWEWTRAEQLCDFITKGTTPKADKLSKVGYIPFIKVHNLTHSGVLDFSVNPTFVDMESHRGSLSRSRVYPNDVFMNIVGPPLGKVSIVPDLYAEWNINQAIAVFRPLPSYDTNFLSYLLLTPQILDWAKRRAKATAGQFNLTLAICRDLPLPVPPLKEQRFIVEEVERRLSVADKLEATVEASLKQAGVLRQSILKRAFSGELVPQDPNDEPAGVLLERIRLERRGADGKSKRVRMAKRDDGAQGRLI